MGLLFWVACSNTIAAPVFQEVPGLQGFRAEKVGDDVHLEWTMEPAYMGYDFIIERSLDGQDFAAIGFVEAGGELKGPLTYGYIDPNVVVYESQILYYRLVEIGPKDRNYPSHSIPVSQLDYHGILIDYFPHPEKPNVVNIAYRAEEEGELLMQIVDAQGNAMYYSPLPTGKGFLVKEVSTAKFPAGTYQIQVFDAHYAVAKEMKIEE